PRSIERCAALGRKPSQKGVCGVPGSKPKTRDGKTKGPLAGAFAVDSAGRQTASLAALTGRARTILRAGLALNIISSPVKGLVPLRALVAGFLTTTNLAKPGTRNRPFFFSSLWPTSTRVSITFLTSRLDSEVPVAIRSMSWDLESWVAIGSPSFRIDLTINQVAETQARSAQLYWVRGRF